MEIARIFAALILRNFLTSVVNPDSYREVDTPLKMRAW